MRYLTIVGMLSGTGIQDSYTGEYIDSAELGLSVMVRERISTWIDEYGRAHMNGFKNRDQINKLDEEGITICGLVHTELKDVKVQYYSEGKCKNVFFPESSIEVDNQ